MGVGGARGTNRDALEWFPLGGVGGARFLLRFFLVPFCPGGGDGRSHWLPPSAVLLFNAENAVKEAAEMMRISSLRRLRPTSAAVGVGLTLTSSLLMPSPPALCAAAAAGSSAGSGSGASSPLGPLSDFIPSQIQEMSTLQAQMLGVSGLTGYTAGSH